ncbi:trans-aconitate 2-methyltransferase [Sphingomonas sp. 28-63-12]|uniref:class I SAM-dependent methyltransferase n=1 Tax=Sphingomonas sp. 28-63-12 TaxID=1970434 RepID=UPI000BD0AAD5|nr:MAG: hypothetical protein B7Y47_08370 [Sphingomonas sp. 28-63-12]
MAATMFLAAKRLARRLPFYRNALVVWDLLRGGEAAQSRRLLLAQPDGLFQPFGTTGPDRYPALFGLIRMMIDDSPDRSLLSFGCSTGEEVASLRRLFTQAQITGIDISADRIALCRRRLLPALGGGTRFEIAPSTTSQAPASHDAVFAMAVFRHGGLSNGPASATPLLRFDRFAAEVAHIAACLKPGGYLIIRHANFRVEDTAAAAEFDAVHHLPRSSPVYDRDNHLVVDDHHEGVIFRKRP